jgi:hypothetical protein
MKGHGSASDSGVGSRRRFGRGWVGSRLSAGSLRAIRAAGRTVGLLGLVVVTGGVGLGSAGAAQGDSPPLLPASDQGVVPAVMSPTSLTLKPTARLLFGKTPQETVAGLVRDPKLSDQSASVYDDADGNAHIAQVFTAPVNFQDASGAWVPIQPQLVGDGSGGFMNKAGPFQLGFPASWSTVSPVTYAAGAYSLSVSLEGMAASAPKLAADQQTVSYGGVLPAVDYAFSSTTAGYRDVITLQNLQAPATITENLSVTGGISLELQKDGSIGILGQQGVLVGSIPAPVASDSSINPETGSANEGPASYAIATNPDGGYTLSVNVDPNWLAQATFPVTIDPSITPTNPSIDSYVDDGFPGTSYSSATTLQVKAQSSSNAQHALALFGVGGYFQPNRIVLSAQTALYATSVANTSTQVAMKKITGSWGSGVTWGTQPTVGSTVYDTDSG